MNFKVFISVVIGSSIIISTAAGPILDESPIDNSVRIKEPCKLSKRINYLFSGTYQ